MPRSTSVIGSACGVLAAGLVALAAPAASGPRDPLLLWTDADGTVRYTSERERIPLARRSAAVVVEPPRAVPPARTGSEWDDGDDDDARAEAPLPPVEAQAEVPAEAPARAPEVDAHLAALDARIAELERAVAADEAVLADRISDPDSASALHASPEVAAIAERLPRLQAELRELRARRAAAAAPDAP